MTVLFFWAEVSSEGAEEPFVYEKASRDPFWPLVTEDGRLIQGFSGVSLEDIYLEGIVWDPDGGSVAMVNGMILKEGDQIGDFKILKIENDRIQLDANGEQRYLKLQIDEMEL